MYRKRIFVGAPIGEHLKNNLLSWLGKNKDLPVRWIMPAGWHITLLPPWNEDNLNKAKEFLAASVTDIEPFEIEYKKISLGPSPLHPRLIWAEGVASEELTELRKKLLDGLQKKSGERTFRPHVTLARFNERDFKLFPERNIDEVLEFSDTIDSVCLYESYPNSVYSVLHRAYLA